MSPAIAAAQSTGDPTRVVGTLLLLVHDKDLSEIELPDQTVTLREVRGRTVDTAVTTLDGRFEALAPQPGLFQICWELGGTQGCSESFLVGKSTVWAGLVYARSKQPFVYGLSLTGDQRPCWVNDSFFQLDVSTSVSGGGFTTRANVQGEYALIGPGPGQFRLTARCERARGGATVMLAGGPLRQDLPLNNRAPRLTGLSANNGTIGLTSADVGSELNLVSGSRDLDGDTVEFMWRTLGDDSGQVIASNSDTAQWKLANSAGLKNVYVMARDGRGGYAFKRFELVTGEIDISVSGRVIDEVGSTPVRNAEVTLGSGTATTDNNGWFSVSTAPQDDRRYVLNIQHPDYALMSRVYDRSARGNTYEMTRAQVTVGSGGGDIVIIDTRSAGPCGSGADKQERPLRRLVAPTILAEESGKDDPRSEEEIRKINEAILAVLKAQTVCDRRGAEIVIPGRSLVDGAGNTWTGPVRAAVTTLNPARRALPGDYRAITASGDVGEMLSFGAVDIALTDMQGNALNLAPGAAAEIRVPVSDFQIPASPSDIPLWFYDQKSGYWIEQGSAELRNTASGWMYVGKTEHFSTINMDVAGTDPDFATCVRVEVDAAFSGWSNLTLRAYVSYGGTSVQVKETALDNAQYHAIYRIPFGNDFPPNTLRLELRGTSAGQELVLLDDIINTDARPKMTGTDLWPPYPYTECGDPILLTPAPGVVPAYGDIDATGRPAFLTGPFGAFNPADGATQSTNYYAAIDPGSNKTTLGDWWQANGFGADGLGAGNPTYVNQGYLNYNDLGFGRDMHCLSSGADVACYVTNYGLPDQNPANADDAESKNPVTRGATVAMEYDASAPAAERVQFYVFGGGVAGSGRINFADLDGLGPKPVPFLCAVCHGGLPTLNGSNKAEEARFREFDLPSFRYSGDRGWDYGDATLSAAELANFADLNELAQVAQAGATPISALISNWYPGGFAGGPAPVLPNVPAGWNTQVSGYHNVFGKSCRTCHVARDEGDPNGYFVFNSASSFSGTSYAVCGFGTPVTRIMPNAVVTYKNFWADTPRVLQYETLVSAPANSCDD